MNPSDLGTEERRVFEKLVKITEEYLDKAHPGLLAHLDWYFYHKYRESFLYHLLLKPEETVSELLDYYGAESFDKADTLKYLLYVVFKQFFINNPSYLEEALNYIKQQDWTGLRALIKRYISIILKQ